MLYNWLFSLSEHISFFNVFRYITVRTVLSSITAFLFVFITGNYFIKIFKKWNVIQKIREDGPKKHIIEKKNTPTMGGILIYLAVIISCVLWCKLDNNYVHIVLFSATWFAGVGFLDDYLKIKIGVKGLSVKSKLFLQLLGSFFIVLLFYKLNEATFKYINYVNIPFIKHPFYLPAWIFFVFAILIIAGWSNAVNLTDGLDGLATGLSIFVFATFIVMAYVIGNLKTSQYLLIMYIPKSSELTIVCGAFIGALLGFLWYNAYPAQMFMGDLGSLMLGGVIGTLAILIKQELLLFIVGIVFVVELFSVILQVTSYKITQKRIFKMAPIHHHFQLKGISEPKIIIRFWIIAIIILLLTLSTLKLR